jgi:prolyl-tRNA editing enzyme YbaK/EbsC (Cys-tRNA(Pro) deacylase)
MSAIFENSSVQRVQGFMKELGMKGEITALADSARTAKEAADALGIKVGQVASSIVFKLDDGSPLLVITSGRHKVDTELVAKELNQSKLHRVDADYV